jgi:hypothetical protein
MLFRGIVVGAASGKVGAMVASHNKGGQYMRARTTPTNPRTIYQTAVRDALRSLSNAWENTLSAGQTNSWNVYASNVTRRNRIGDTTKSSGFSWYVGNNIPRLQAALPRVDDAPVVFNTGQADLSGTILITNTAFGGTVSLGSAGLPSSAAEILDNNSNSSLLVFVSRPFPGNRASQIGGFRYATSIPGNDTNQNVGFTLPFARGSTENNLQATITIVREDGRTATGFRFPG